MADSCQLKYNIAQLVHLIKIYTSISRNLTTEQQTGVPQRFIKIRNVVQLLYQNVTDTIYLNIRLIFLSNYCKNYLHLKVNSAIVS